MKYCLQICMSVVVALCCVHGAIAKQANHMVDTVNIPEIEILEHESKTHKRNKRKIYYFPIHVSRKWPTTINFMLSDKLTTKQHSIIINVLQNDFEANTCLKFNQISNYTESNDTQYILFRDHDILASSTCKTYIGQEEDIRTFHGQPVYLGETCFFYRGTMVHMIGATLGMFNEMRRPDRDLYVDIFWKNIDPEGFSQFAKESNHSVTTYNIPYDYASATHFQSTAWRKDRLSGYTVLPKDRSLTHLLGQKSEISYYDIMALNHAYCSDICTTSMVCDNGGYQNPKNCNQCLCPDGWAGTTCQLVEPSPTNCLPTSGKLNAQKMESCVASPYYPSGNYRVSDKCTWLIEAPPGKLIDFWFHESVFYLPFVLPDICLHWVEIKYKGLNATRGSRFCSKDNNINNLTMPVKMYPFTSQDSRMMVLFKAPDSNLVDSFFSGKLKGFKLCYKIADQISTTTRSTTISTTTSKDNNAAKTGANTGGMVNSGLSDSMVAIVTVILILLLLLIVFAIIIIYFMYKKRKNRQSNPVGIACGMNNGGYDAPIVTLHNIGIVDKKMAEFEAFGALGVDPADLPPKYDDVPPGQAPAYTFSNNLYSGLISERPPPPPEPVYTIPNIGNNLVPVSNRPVPPTPGMEDDVIYQNTAVNDLRSRFEQN